MENLSFVYIQSYSSTSNSAIQSLQMPRPRWKELILFIISFVNVTLFMSFTVLDIMKMVEYENVDKMSSAFVYSGSTDFPAAMVENISTQNYTPSFTFDMVALLSVLFVPFLLLYGIITEKKYDVYASLLIMGVTVLYMVPDVFIYDNWMSWYKKVRLFSALVLTVASIPITIQTVNEKTWMEFRVPGTSDGMMELYRRLKYFDALLHFDFFILCLLALLNMRSGIGSSLGDYIFALSLIFYGVICLVLATVAVNKEVKRLVFIFLALAILLPIWVPIQISMSSCLSLKVLTICTDEQYIFSYCILSTGILVVIVRTYLIMELLKVYRNFGYGLTDTAFVGLIVSESSGLLSTPRI